jgi:ankyrin repeat protein
VKASPDAISMLFQAFPNAVEEKDDNGDFPLHLAFSKQASPEIVKMIFQACEKGAKEKNDNGDCPLHYALLET